MFKIELQLRFLLGKDSHMIKLCSSDLSLDKKITGHALLNIYSLLQSNGQLKI